MERTFDEDGGFVRRYGQVCYAWRNESEGRASSPPNSLASSKDAMFEVAKRDLKASCAEEGSGEILELLTNDLRCQWRRAGFREAHVQPTPGTDVVRRSSFRPEYLVRDVRKFRITLVFCGLDSIVHGASVKRIERRETLSKNDSYECEIAAAKYPASLIRLYYTAKAARSSASLALFPCAVMLLPFRKAMMRGRCGVVGKR